MPDDVHTGLLEPQQDTGACVGLRRRRIPACDDQRPIELARVERKQRLHQQALGAAGNRDHVVDERDVCHQRPAMSS
jgi:hypothetical protein